MSEAVKRRIMNHMNKVCIILYLELRDVEGTKQDHTDSLSDYLQFYCALPRSGIDKPWMIDLSDDGMTLRASETDSEEYFVPFEPVLAQLEGIRPRVIEMAQLAKSGIAAGRTVEDDDDEHTQ